ncbi:HAMP domain-containing sensor histidine kinase [Lysinibacillus sp. KU-BSD001]|uniref:sensor histidine kinase n=1 Tax=Lysinibacillus sp. KU-BSD001 TaxID=3141328 RepID=UPI0036EE75A7
MWWFGIVIAVTCIFYIIYLQKQLRNVNRQLAHRLQQKSEQLIQIQLFDDDLNELIKNINRLMQNEQESRLSSKREARYYKEMVSNISHDFRTPLTAVKGYQQLLLQDTLSDEQRAKLVVAQKHVLRLEQLVETFFEYSYLLSSEEQPTCQRIIVNQLIIETVAGVFTQLEERGLAVSLPSDKMQIVMYSDEEMVVRIVQNLLRNCIAHSNGNVEINYWQDDIHTFITFKNPIEVNDVADPNMFFNRFYTTDRTRRKNTGLGLSIVRLLSEKLGGSAIAQIENGQIIFTITLKNRVDD